MTISILDFTPQEQEKLARLLCVYFPWLLEDPEENDVSGADTIQELEELYSSLPQQK